jgi:hypothetical protein
MRHPHSSPGTWTTTAHRDKRPFQPSITSFFAREDADDDADADADADAEDYYHHHDTQERGPGPISRTSQQQHQARDNSRGAAASLRAKDRETVFPTVPGHVQADLLSVGMRVRKSVPEGYKTHKIGPLSLPSIQTTLSNGHSRTTTTTHTATITETYSVKPPRDPVPDALQHQRELLPFCGLHKIGGYAEQPVTNGHLYGVATDGHGDKPVNLFPLPAEAFNQPFPSSSQSSSSTDSLPPNPTNAHKRSWQDDEHLAAPASGLNPTSPFAFALPMKVAEDEVPVSPLSETPIQSISSLPQTALRPFAQPKTRRPQQHGRIVDVDGALLLKESDVDMDLENAGQGVGDDGQRGSGSSSDFGEAPFLTPWAGAAAEVEMGGV